jgi:hypothetical protein
MEVVIIGVCLCVVRVSWTCLEHRIKLWRLPQPWCKGFDGRLQGHNLVEHELPFMDCSPENRMMPLWRWFSS